MWMRWCANLMPAHHPTPDCPLNPLPPAPTAALPDPTATNVDAVVYLMLANELVHDLLPDAITIAEDVSGERRRPRGVRRCRCM